MKLDKLWIKEFKNLRDVEVDFDEDQLITVVIGWNGAGKSNLLEALVIIFRDLDLGETPRFAYKLNYICRNRYISIDADPERARKDKVKITLQEPGDHLFSVQKDVKWGVSEPVSFSKFYRDPERTYLPSNIFGYYSGPSNRFERHFDRHQKKFYKALLADERKPLRPLFNAKLIHSQFVLLSFFIGKDEKVIKFLKEKLFIEGLESVLFVMKKPSWTSKEGDNRFWNARGVVQHFLDKLFEISLGPMKRSRRVSVGLSKTQTQEFLFLFVKDEEQLQKLQTIAVDDSVSNKDRPREFFKLLESTYISEILEEVMIRVKVRELDGSLTFKELSEGEQQLLTVLGLLRFTREDESLFLLDEPDTHLNPAWSMDYLKFLEDVAGLDPHMNQNENSHILLATHDPLVLANLSKRQIQIMKRDSETMKVYAELPAHDPKGLGVTGILMSDMFGLRSDLDKETLADLDEHAQLLAVDALNETQSERLIELKDKLNSFGFMHSYSDPYFASFVKEWIRSRGTKKISNPPLSDKDRAEMKKVTEGIISKLNEKKE